MIKEASGIPVHCAFDSLLDVASLVPNPRNPNKHGDRQIALLSKIIRHQGWRAPIVVSNRSGFVVAGHGRLEASKLLGVELVPVNRQDFATEADEWAHLVADNRIAELSEINLEDVKGLISDAKDFDVELFGYDENAFNLLMGEKINPLDYWDGMPDYLAEVGAKRKISILFNDEQGCSDFSKFIGCEITTETKSIWFSGGKFILAKSLLGEAPSGLADSPQE